MEEAKKSSNNDAARTHSVDESLIRRWRKQEWKLREALSSGKTRFRLEGGGRKYGHDYYKSNTNPNTAGAEIEEGQNKPDTTPYFPSSS